MLSPARYDERYSLQQLNDDKRVTQRVCGIGEVHSARHRIAAPEPARICRPGGTIVITVSAPDSFNTTVRTDDRTVPQTPDPRPGRAHPQKCFSGTPVELSSGPRHGPARSCRSGRPSRRCVVATGRQYSRSSDVSRRAPGAPAGRHRAGEYERWGKQSWTLPHRLGLRRDRRPPAHAAANDPAIGTWAQRLDRRAEAKTLARMCRGHSAGFETSRVRADPAGDLARHHLTVDTSAFGARLSGSGPYGSLIVRLGRHSALRSS
jgi:hypothetical protein